MGVHTNMGWHQVADFDSHASFQHDITFAGPRKSAAGRISVKLLSRLAQPQVEQLNLILTEGCPMFITDICGLCKD